MTRLIIGWGWFVACVLGGFTDGSRAQDAAALPVPELAPLNHFLGTWDIHVTSDDRQIHLGRNVCSWIVGRRYLQIVSTLVSPDGSKEVELLSLLTFDTEKRVYRRWIFTADGQVLTGEGTWDEATRTLRMVFPDPKGDGSSEIIVTFPQEGRAVWKIRSLDPQGNMRMEVRGENRRHSPK